MHLIVEHQKWLILWTRLFRHPLDVHNAGHELVQECPRALLSWDTTQVVSSRSPWLPNIGSTNNEAKCLLPRRRIQFQKSLFGGEGCKHNREILCIFLIRSYSVVDMQQTCVHRSVRSAEHKHKFSSWTHILTRKCTFFFFLRKGGDSEYWLIMYELTWLTQSTHEEFIPQICSRSQFA